MPKTVFNIRANPEVLDKLRVIADKENRTLTNLIETILLKYLEEQEGSK